MRILNTLLADLPAEYRVTTIYVGQNWTLAILTPPQGAQVAGVASTPAHIDSGSRFQIGQHTLDEDVRTCAQLLRSSDEVSAAVALAVLNALHQPDNLSRADAADWLASKCAGRRAAFIGRFPFIDDEIRPQAAQVWVFEQVPLAGELGVNDMPDILPQAEVVAMTSSTIINHTIDGILSHIKAESLVVLLGPSTPLTEKLFTVGIGALFGVRVVDVGQAIASVQAGAGFQKMQGLERVALFKR